MCSFWLPVYVLYNVLLHATLFLRHMLPSGGRKTMLGLVQRYVIVHFGTDYNLIPFLAPIFANNMVSFYVYIAVNVTEIELLCIQGINSCVYIMASLSVLLLLQFCRLWSPKDCIQISSAINIASL